MRRLVIRNTEYKLRMRFKENGKRMLNVRRDIQENPYCWDSTYRNINMSWRRYKKMLINKVRKHQLIRI